MDRAAGRERAAGGSAGADDSAAGDCAEVGGVMRQSIAEEETKWHYNIRQRCSFSITAANS